MMFGKNPITGFLLLLLIGVIIVFENIKKWIIPVGVLSLLLFAAARP